MIRNFWKILKLNNRIIFPSNQVGDRVPFFKKSHLILLLVLFTMLILATVVQARESTPTEEDVPYGVASNWLYGHFQLSEGNVEEALRYLHAVYRTHPDVPQVAWDFQEALVAGHYFKDANEVLDKLVKDWPENPVYRLQRSNVSLQLGKEKEALQDLQELRNMGLANLDVIISEATILSGMGKANQAIDVCRAALNEFPDDGPRLYLAISVILDQENRQSEIPAILEEAVIEYPDSPQLHDILVRSLMSLGKEKQAMEVARAADDHFKNLAENHGADSEILDADGVEHRPRVNLPPSFVVEVADMYSQQGNLEKAIEILDPMFDRGDLAREPSLWLARLHLGTNDVQRGMELVDNILEKWPNTGQAWFIRGRGLESEGRIEEALVDFSKGVKYAPEDAQVRLGYIRGMLLAWENDFQSTVENSGKLEKIELLKEQALAAVDLISEADTEGNLILGYAFRNVHELTLAVNSFTNAANDPGLTIPATLQMSVCYDELGDDENALAVLKKLREQFPQNAEVANSLGYFLAEKGKDLEFAHDLISEALASNPGTGAYLDSMGWVLYQLGKNDDAFDYMIQAVNVLPNDPVILEHLALVLMKMGQTDEAEEMLRRALLLGGDKDRLENFLNNLPDKGAGE